MQKLKADRVFSRGIVAKPAYVVKKRELKASKAKLSSEAEVEANLKLFQESIDAVATDLEVLAAESEIFAGHLAIALDFALHDSVKSKISVGKENVELAVENSIQEFAGLFSQMEDEYMRERAADVEDVGERLMAKLQNQSLDYFSAIQSEVIVVAEELTPSDTSAMDFDLVKGFITEKGGITSHVCIIAKSLGIPAIVGVPDVCTLIKNEDMLIMDAETGEIIIEPDQETLDTFLVREKAMNEEAEAMLASAKLPAKTEDGHTVKVYANVGSITDVKNALKFEVTGVGLFRSEFLFMDASDFPSEEEQFEAYKEAASSIEDEVIIRTLDIGGDKELVYFDFAQEENPFLGFRAIRICLAKRNVFKTQLKAILRASAFGKIKIMLPMIIALNEVIESKKIIEECKLELKERGLPFDEKIEVGVMIETPAAVICADLLAKEVDFFSIGTNDLTQYVLAVDRGNEAIKDLYNSFSPAVLRSINMVIEAGHKEGIEVGMCGEFASNPLITEVLLGMGLDEFSMAAAETPRIKNKIRSLNLEKAKVKAQAVLAMGDTKEIEDFLAEED